MKIGYKKLLIFILFILAVLSVNSFTFNFLSKYKMIIFILILLMFFGRYFVFEKVNHRYMKDILFEVMLCLVTFFILYFLLGLFVGLARTQNYLTFNGLKNFILPVILFCVLREIFRYNMLCKAEGNMLCTIFVVLLFIAFDISNDIYYSSFKTQHDILRFVALVLLPSISSNISFSYVSKKTGYIPVIIFNLVFSLFQYIIPILPNPNEYLMSMIYLLVPVFFSFRILKFFELKKDERIPSDYHKKKFKGIFLPVFVIFIIIYFNSGYFKFYAVVIASGSMNPNIKIGDIVIVDQKYKEINEKDVIAYRKDKLIIVHRVVKKVKYRDSYLYYTKGDANSNIDDFVIEADMIVGKVESRIPYVGYPTVWFNKK